MSKHGPAVEKQIDNLIAFMEDHMLHRKFTPAESANMREVLYTFGQSAENIALGAVLGGVLNENIYRNADVRDPALSGEMILGSLKKGDILLVKASRGAAAERILAYLKENKDRLCSLK